MRESGAARAFATVVVAAGLVFATRGCAFDLPDLVVHGDAGQGGQGGTTASTTSTAATGGTGGTSTSSTSSSTTSATCTAQGAPCTQDAQCCAGWACGSLFGPGGSGTCCAGTGTGVDGHSQLCCSGSAVPMGACTCNGAGAACTVGAACCSGSCANAVCCTALGAACQAHTECCSGCCNGTCADASVCWGGG